MRNGKSGSPGGSQRVHPTPPETTRQTWISPRRWGWAPELSLGCPASGDVVTQVGVTVRCLVGPNDPDLPTGVLPASVVPSCLLIVIWASQMRWCSHNGMKWPRAHRRRKPLWQRGLTVHGVLLDVVSLTHQKILPPELNRRRDPVSARVPAASFFPDWPRERGPGAGPPRPGDSEVGVVLRHTVGTDAVAGIRMRVQADSGVHPLPGPVVVPELLAATADDEDTLQRHDLGLSSPEVEEELVLLRLDGLAFREV